MSPLPIQLTADHIDFGPRGFFSTTVAGSPALAAETIVCSVAVTGDIAISKGIFLDGWAAFTVGTSGSAVRLRIRQTGLAGSVIADTGALTGGIAAAALVAQDINGVDTAPVLPAQTYVLTLQVTAGGAVSTVSGVSLTALLV